MSDTVHWICDTRLTRRREGVGQPEVEDAARALGYRVTTLVFDATQPDLPTLPPDGELCVVAYGTREFLEAVKRRRPRWRPGAFADHAGLSHAVAVKHLGEMMLNADAETLSLNEIALRGRPKPGEQFFIKPAGVEKPFAGQVLNHDTFPAWGRATLKRRLSPGMLCLVAPPKAIQGEFRFVIVDGEVVAGSQYRWAGRLDFRSDVLPAARALADRVAGQPWQPERAYVCDVAITDAGAKVVELNAFSSSGLYASDTEAVVRAVSRVAVEIAR